MSRFPNKDEIADILIEDYKAELERVTKQRDDLIRAMRGVIACFKSRVGGCDDVGCINDHHPSCRDYLERVLKTVTGGL